MSGFRVLVFDWDGTLIDSAARIVEAVHAAIGASGLDSRDDAQIRETIGLGMPEAVAALYPDEPATARERLAAAYREAFVRAAAERPASLFPGAAGALARLDGCGYLLAVATGKSRAGLRRELGRAGLAERFVITRTADECGSKPHPRMLHEILDHCGADPAEALMVGDTLFDMEMAAHAGVPSLGVSWGAHDAERLAGAATEGLVATFDGLLERLDPAGGRARPDTH